VLTNLAPRHVRSFPPRRTVVVLVAAVAVLLGFVVSPPTSRADTSSTLTIVGTSDVQDSGLFDNVLKPDFEAFYDSTHANPITTTYLSQGTQTAINTAESGAASALLVHAASLENQFVGGGFSAEPFGRAIFFGDFVLLGPASDPAGVMSGASPSHDVVGAFEKIATAGAAGHANFVSRNDNSGTNVEEHEIWADTTVPGCTVSATNGGGKTPSTTAGDCPTTPTPPAWYQATSAKQAQNVEITDTCNFPTGPHDCYTITDRGTFENLESQPGALHDLQIVGNNNSASAPGGDTLLVNSFHAYAINPDNPTIQASGDQLNLAGAEAFLNWVTSPAGQNDVNAYLSKVPGGSPFRKDAAPSLTTSTTLPKTVDAGKAIKIKGKLSNVVPGTPPLAGKEVRLMALRSDIAKANPNAQPVTVARTSTTKKGHFSFKYIPDASARYALSTGRILQVENDTLSPVFGDLLAPTSRRLGRTKVHGAISIHSLSVHNGHVTVRGSLAPAPTTAFAKIHVLAAHAAGNHKLKAVATRRVKADKHHFVVHFRLQRGLQWLLRLRYVTHGQTSSGKTKIRSVSVT
jgi:tungstate transport system substrate-binding protein